MSPFLILLLVASSSAVLRNPSRCFYKAVEAKGKVSVGRSRNASTVLNQAECFMKCLENRRCRLLSFNKETNQCALNPVLGSRLSLSADVLGAAFRKVCLDSFFEGKPLRDSPAGDLCYERTPGKVLIGVVDQLVQDIATEAQCQELCSTVNSDKEGTCKSVMFYAKERECIVASQNRKEMPELFTDDQNAVYLENMCVGGTTPRAASIAARPPAPIPSSATENFSEKLAVKPPTSDTKDYGTDFDPFETPKKPLPVHIESSGYETGPIPSAAPHFPAPKPPTQPSVVVVPEPKPHPHETVLTHSETRKIETLPPMIEPKTIDTYNVDTKKPATNDLQSYRRRLRDPKINKCFRQIFARDVVHERVVRSYSLEQCIDICRLCEGCLPGGKCHRVAFSMIYKDYF
uniref:Apple domain-containing protein n=1 Tax=Steinernema glaseri TaxID=37863 RepID=A0A1I8AKS5_9BILA